MSGPRFIRPIHPKASIAPRREAVKRILGLGWWGQTKVHGHRAQIHIPAGEGAEIVVFNRQGQPHRKILPLEVAAEVLRIFRPTSGAWSVIDAEWLKSEDRLFVFDLLKRNDKLLEDSTYAERYEQLPRLYKSPKIETLPPLRTVEACMAVLEDPAAHVEGLVFKSPTTRGFPDTSVVRCRKPNGTTAET